MPQIDANRNASRKAVKRATRKPKVKPPSKTRIKQAKAQQQQYVSQGKAVEKTANSQRKTNRARAQERTYVSQGQSVEKTANSQRKKALKKRTKITAIAPLGSRKLHAPTLRDLEQIDRYESSSPTEQKRQDEQGLKTLRLKRAASTGKKLAPVLKVVEQTTRPLHLVAATERSVIKSLKTTGRIDPIKALEAAGRGAANKDKSTYSDVLGDLGVKNKTVKAVGGFAGDVVGDPLTYVTGGAGSVLRHAATKEAERVTKKAIKKGLTAEQAERMGQRAAKKAATTVKDEKGATVKFAGREVAGVRKATAVATRPVKKITRKTGGTRGGQAVKNAAADVNPGAAPAGVVKAQSERVRMATRTARAKTNRGLDEAQQRAIGLKDKLGEKNYSQVIDALESGKLGDLPPDLRAAAVDVRSQLRYANRLRKRAGIKGGEIKKRPKVSVPAVAADVNQSAKDLGRARRREIAARRELEQLRVEHGVAQGRAEVLSRNVSGRRGEAAAERSMKLRRIAGSRAGANGSARDVLKYIDRMDSGQRYAGGGLGVKQAIAAIDAAEAKHASAKAALKAAQSGHETMKLAAAEQRAARAHAIETNTKRSTGPKNYVPHARVDKATGYTEDIPEVIADRGGSLKVQPGSSKRRLVNKTLAELRAEGRTIKPGEKVPKDLEGLYSEDLPLLVANRMSSGKASVARAELNRTLAAEGKRVKPGTTPDLKALARNGEGVYHVKGSNIDRIVDPAELSKVRNGQLVVLNTALVERAQQGITGGLRGKGAIHLYDKAQSGFKRVATATPGFHVRNFVGDTQNAYLGQSGRKLPGNMVKAGRVLKAAGRQEKAVRSLSRSTDGKATLPTKLYGNVTYDEVARQLAKTGAYRSGFVARETKDLARSGDKGLTKVRKAVTPKAIRTIGLNREDLPRLATAVDALRNGATYEQAAAHVAKYHFDYGDLTDFERNVARRFAPFYTFTARNVPLQAKTLVTKPGKYANYQKVREEAAKASQPGEQDAKTRQMYTDLEKAGVKLPKGWERSLSEWEQRNAGIPIAWKGHKFTLSFGLPLGDLNEIPGAAGSKQFDEYFQKVMSMGSPLLKDPVEYFSNFSFFFRDQIEREYSPNVSAPSYVAGFPAGLKQKIGVKKITDKRTGKMVWGWPAKVDYIAKAVPGTPNFVQQMLTQGSDRRGRDSAMRVLGFSGVKTTPVDPVQNAQSLAYARQSEIQKELAGLRQQGVGRNNPTLQWRKLNDQLKIVTQIAYQAKAAAGYKVLPTNGGPKKPKVRKTSPSVSTDSGGFFNDTASSSSGSSGSSGGGGFFNP